MSANNTITNKIGLLLIVLLYMVLGSQMIYGQEASPSVSSNSTYHNQVFFNRFLINPTFSLVRENKSYVNILHRNQYATFEDNSQNYFLGFSNKLNDHTALGISVYSQWSGVVQEFGFNANYATSVRLGAKSKLTFGTNVTYFNEGLDKNRVVATEEDTRISEAGKESKLAIQPGVALSIGKFDFGLYATDLFKYNQTTNTFLTSLNDKSIKASLQYTHSFMANRGLFANARFMPLVQVGKNLDGSLAYLGSLLLDLPKYGWLQTTLDDNYGLSMGLGFNLSKTMSLGYLLEKDVLQDKADLGWNHEVSLAYTFKNQNDGAGGYVDSSKDAQIDNIVKNYEEQILRLIAEKNAALGKNEGDGKTKNAAKSKFNESQETPAVAYEKAVVPVVEERIERKSRAARKNRTKRKSKKQTVHEEDISSLAYQNRLILDELILRQDSIEAARTAASEKRFETIVRVLRNDIKYNLKAYLQDTSSGQYTDLALTETRSDTPTNADAALPSNPRASEAPKSADKALAVTKTVPKSTKSAHSAKFKEPIESPIADSELAQNTASKPAQAKTGAIASSNTFVRPAYNPLPIESFSAEQDGFVVEIQTETETEDVLNKEYVELALVDPDGKEDMAMTGAETPRETMKELDKVAVTLETKPEIAKGLSTLEHKDYFDLPIKVLDQADFVGVKSGYYVIANVYSSKKYLKAFMSTLKEQGLDARQFYNKENGLYYVYLADFNFKEEAKTAYVSNLDGKYKDEKWIMQVDHASAIVDNMYVD